MITLWETQPHYGRHLLPIASELETRGIKYTYVPGWEVPAQREDGVLVVAAYRDFKRQKHWGARVLVEHGIGQSYNRPHPGYSGGQREPYDLLLAPGHHVVDSAARQTVAVGNLPGERLGALNGTRLRTVVVFSFHWPCSVVPEAGTAYETFAPHLTETVQILRRHGIASIALPHPRWEGSLNQRLHEHGLGVLANDAVEEALLQSVCWVGDNSSLMFEAAALDVPVVVLDDVAWRRDVKHGKRFWEWALVGLEVRDPRLLASAVITSMADDPMARVRRKLVNEVYAPIASPAETAVDSLLEVLSDV